MLGTAFNQFSPSSVKLLDWQTFVVVLTNKHFKSIHLRLSPRGVSFQNHERSEVARRDSSRIKGAGKKPRWPIESPSPTKFHVVHALIEVLLPSSSSCGADLLEMHALPPNKRTNIADKFPFPLHSSSSFHTRSPLVPNYTKFRIHERQEKTYLLG
jgi:hypothetical protein